MKALNTPKLGDSLLRADGTPWMADLANSAPKLNWDDLAQTAALPLGSWLKTDPWDDKVHMLNAKRYAPMNARDKMPLEVTPIFFKLQRYDNQAAAPAAPGTAAPSADSAAPAAQPEEPPAGYTRQRPPNGSARAPSAAGNATAQQQPPPQRQAPTSSRADP